MNNITFKKLNELWLQLTIIKRTSQLFIIMNIVTGCYAKEIIDYNAIIQPCVNSWKNDCISQLSTEDIIIITDTILLSYQVVQASIMMLQARLVIQSELFNIVTLSINDTFDVRIQAQNNDLTAMKDSIKTIEESQEQMKFAYDTLKKFGPLLINIDPSTIQFFISNLKGVILNWAKTQHETITDLQAVQQEFMTTADLFSNIRNIFDVIITTEPVEHSHLLHGANSITGMYKKIEDTLARLTITRQDGLANLETLLTLFFKHHYEVLYNHLQMNNIDEIILQSTLDHKLPNPQNIFLLPS